MACQYLLYVYIERSDGSDPETQTGLFFLPLYGGVTCGLNGLKPKRLSLYLLPVTRDKACVERVVPPSQLPSLRLKMTTVRLYPPLFEEGKSAEFLRTGRTLSVTQSPRDNSVAVYATNTAVGRISIPVFMHRLIVMQGRFKGPQIAQGELLRTPGYLYRKYR
jgi:hypothetical protein